MMTDPIADLLTRIRNGSHARKDRVDVPWSKVKERVTAVLVDEGYLKDFAVVGEGPSKELRIGLRYDAQRRPVITGIQRVSRPSLRVYVGALYHDIGKLNKPEYFVENQSGGYNKHEKLSPAMSLLVIIGHVNPGQRTGITFTTKVLSNSPGGQVSNLFPPISVDSAGNVYVVWSDPGDHNLYYKYSTDQGNTWSPTVRPSSTSSWRAMSSWMNPFVRPYWKKVRRTCSAERPFSSSR